jgi:hypothetical protein
MLGSTTGALRDGAVTIGRFTRSRRRKKPCHKKSAHILAYGYGLNDHDERLAVLQTFYAKPENTCST